MKVERSIISATPYIKIEETYKSGSQLLNNIENQTFDTTGSMFGSRSSIIVGEFIDFS